MAVFAPPLLLMRWCERTAVSLSVLIHEVSVTSWRMTQR